MSKVRLIHGECLAVMRGMPDASVDSIVCDPPYGLGQEPDAIAMLRDWMTEGHHEPKSKRGFMGKEWDAFVPQPAVWAECFRVLKPGGYLIAFAGTRTHDLMTLGIRIAGFEIRDMLAWLHSQGFPKSLDVSKAIDKALGAQREVIGTMPDRWTGKGNTLNFSTDRPQSEVAVTGEAVTGEAVTWQGWGTALKPCVEPLTMARKPLQGTVAANVLKWGTGGLNIDACRIATSDDLNGGAYAAEGGRTESQSMRQGSGMNQAGKTTGREFVQPTGRWPGNVAHDGSEAVLAEFPRTKSGTANVRQESGADRGGNTSSAFGAESRPAGSVMVSYGDEGSAARFFYRPKASPEDRHEGLENPGPQFKAGRMPHDAAEVSGAGKGNHHVSVKPTNLMRWLVRLVTPPGGTCLDPFAGSGSTLKAAELEGFDAIGIEREAQYVAIAEKRIAVDQPLLRDVTVEVAP